MSKNRRLNSISNRATDDHDFWVATIGGKRKFTSCTTCSFVKPGGPDRIRTCDPALIKRML